MKCLRCATDSDIEFEPFEDDAPQGQPTIAQREEEQLWTSLMASRNRGQEAKDTTQKEPFQEAADFAAEVGLHRLIAISHSAEAIEGIVTVWYWGDNLQ